MDEGRDRIIRIIRKLQNMQVEKGFSPSEAAGAAVKIQELLHHHQLSLVDIQTNRLNEDLGRESISTGRKRRNPGETVLANAIARGCDCRLLVDHKNNDYTLNFIGYVSDVQVAKHLYAVLRDGLLIAADQAADTAGQLKQKKVRYRNNFLIGAAGVIYNRLKEERPVAEFEPTDALETIAQVALPPSMTKNALVAIKQPEVDKYYKQLYPRARDTAPCKVRQNYSAVEAGRRAGRTIPIRRAVETASPSLLSVG